MKRINFLAILAISAIVLASCGGRTDNRAEVIERLEAGEIPEEVTRAVIDTQASVIEWLGQKITGSGHNGVISVGEGEIYVYDGKIWGADVVIDMNSIVVVDIIDPDRNARLQGHLESDDFFSVATFPTANMQVVRLEAIEGAADGQPNYRVSGNLTIKGITHTLVFPATISHSEGLISIFADFDFDRSLYDARFGSGRFFENLGDNLINDDINIKLNIVATY